MHVCPQLRTFFPGSPPPVDARQEQQIRKGRGGRRQSGDFGIIRLIPRALAIDVRNVMTALQDINRGCIWVSAMRHVSCNSIGNDRVSFARSRELNETRRPVSYTHLTLPTKA